MANVCEHEFEQRDPFNENYSMLEFDLYARLNKTIRKNHITGNYEIVGISGSAKGIVFFEGTLEEVVNKSNELESIDEGQFVENIKIRCGSMCPLQREIIKKELLGNKK